MVITDQASYPQAFPLLAIRAELGAGIDLWLNSGTDNWQIDGYASNPTVMCQLREASRHILYAVSRSLAMNGISSTTEVVPAMATWQKALTGVDVVAGVGHAGHCRDVVCYLLSRDGPHRRHSNDSRRQGLPPVRALRLDGGRARRGRLLPPRSPRSRPLHHGPRLLRLPDGPRQMDHLVDHDGVLRPSLLCVARAL